LSRLVAAVARRNKLWRKKRTAPSPGIGEDGWASEEGRVQGVIDAFGCAFNRLALLF
jgi:hypothetical protein